MATRSAATAEWRRELARIDLDHIRHAYGPNPKSDKDYALREVDHTFEDGGAYALLGPSGCGKTTLLNIISGLLHPSHGKLLFNGNDVTQLSTQERNIAQVFQFPVIYDTMTVYDNLAFPLRNRGVPEADVDRKVREIIKMIDLEDWAKRKARGLTADQKQKISLGRRLVRSDVNAILFDEPLTVIDPHMKWVLRSQLKQLHRQFGYTMVYVTHDQTEALTFAETVVVMYDGQIVQIGTPAELFERPKHTFVGYFIGSPGMNVLPVTVDGSRAKLGGQIIDLPAAPGADGQGAVELGIRPEYIRLGALGMPIQIRKVEDIGRHRVVRGTIEGRDIAAIIGEEESIPAHPRVRFDAAGINLYANSWRVDLGQSGRRP
jgi:glycerol transport system ATP-binding protein